VGSGSSGKRSAKEKEERQKSGGETGSETQNAKKYAIVRNTRAGWKIRRDTVKKKKGRSNITIDSSQLGEGASRKAKVRTELLKKTNER